MELIKQIFLTDITYNMPYDIFVIGHIFVNGPNVQYNELVVNQIKHVELNGVIFLLPLATNA